MDIKDFHVGQTAYLCEICKRNSRKIDEWTLREVTVTKVGKKYVTVRIYASDVQFMSSENARKSRCLVEKTDWGNPCRLYLTREAFEEDRELEELREWMRKAACWEILGRYTLEQLRKAKEILSSEGNDGT